MFPIIFLSLKGIEKNNSKTLFPLKILFFVFFIIIFSFFRLGEKAFKSENKNNNFNTSIFSNIVGTDVIYADNGEDCGPACSECGGVDCGGDCVNSCADSCNCNCSCEFGCASCNDCNCASCQNSGCNCTECACNCATCSDCGGGDCGGGDCTNCIQGCWH